MAEPHIVPIRTYFVIFGLLMLGTYSTVQAAFLDLGAFNTPIALAIAITKATVVVLYFMHVKYSPRLTRIVVMGGLLWLAILLVMTLGDYATRAWRTFG
jgi:cytochrome c oxidase subunit 4